MASKQRTKVVWDGFYSDHLTRVIADSHGVHIDIDKPNSSHTFGISVMAEELGEDPDKIEIAVYPYGNDGRCVRYFLSFEDGELAMQTREEA